MYGLVGFLDDFSKGFRKINEGLNPKQKLLLQLVGGLSFYLFYEERGGDVLNVFGVSITCPRRSLHFLCSIPDLVGFSNTDMTDGIDGLASNFCSDWCNHLWRSLLMYKTNWIFSLVIIAMIGGLLGFFVFNHKPAKAFME